MKKDNAAATVSSLMDERRQFEAWLAALDARRASTPEQVFSRVQADYATRLDAVMAQLSQHTSALRKELEILSSRLSSVQADRSKATDERSEFELRAHVGELSSVDWDKHSTAIDARLAEYDAKHVALEEEIRRTRELLDGAQRPSAALQEINDELEESPAADAIAVDEAVAVSEESVERERSSGAIPAELWDKPLQPAAGASEVAPVPAANFADKPEPRISASAPRANGFDELAFLSSVVDTPSGTIELAPKDRADERTRRDTFALQASGESIVNIASELTPARQLAAIEIEKEADPLTARSAPPDGQKTLKCGACGAMNYPTEWYCESCGSELASL